jgi:hypothetical protein
MSEAWHGLAEALHTHFSGDDDSCEDTRAAVVAACEQCMKGSDVPAAMKAYGGDERQPWPASRIPTIEAPKITMVPRTGSAPIQKTPPDELHAEVFGSQESA